MRPDALGDDRLADVRRELAQTREQLAATSEVLAVLGTSGAGRDEVFDAIVERARRLCRADVAQIYTVDGDVFALAREVGMSPEFVSLAHREPVPRDRTTLVGRVSLDATTQQIVDVLADPDYDRPEFQRLGGYRSIVGAPMIVESEVVGVLSAWRTSVDPFDERVCDLLTTFAVQGALALRTVGLFHELELQRRALERASRHKSEFLASMSHELRTPLNAVIGFSEVLLERMFGELNERQEDYLQDILGAGRHLLALLGDILDLSKVEAGQMELDRSWFDAADAVAGTSALVRERALQHGQRLVADVAPDVGAVSADELRFKQVLVNLLTNAVKFTPDGGEIRVAVRREPGAVEVTVTDTGVGVDAEEQARIFDTFEQGGRLASRSEGTGLGLAVCKRIVELHGGRIWVRSVPGEGSTFGFRLPQPAGAHEVPPPHRPGAVGTADRPVAPPDAPAADDDRPVVLVVEDDDVSAELVSLHVEAAGMRAVRAATGEEGLVLARTASPAAVVLDIRLPGLDGWDVLTRLKSSPGTAHVPVLVVSVLPERGRGFALGAADYLLKPVAREQLLTTLRRVVGDPGARPRRRVLVVDDDHAALELVRVTLEPRGWEVLTCTDGSLAPGLAREHRPGVVLVDLLMPGTDGFAVVDALRAERSTATTPVVVLTAATLSATQRERLRGRIEFVAAKSHLDLVALEGRLAGLVPGGPS